MANKNTLAKAVSESTGKTLKESKEVIDIIKNIISDVLSNGDDVKLIGFGTFKVVQREERIGTNPQTNKPLTIPARKIIKFKAGNIFTNEINS
jgi:DNA-binding protein HU-beta